MERRRAARRDLADPMTKTPRRRDKPRERWLLTRKTWKYMSDAGRRLIPDGAQNRPEDVPRIEAYFQDVCAREPRFLLWRKSSFPGALPRPRRRKRARGGSVRARSPDDDAPPPPPQRPADLYIGHVSGGRFDIAKLRREFFAAPPPAPAPALASPRGPAAPPPADDIGDLVDLLRRHLKVVEDAAAGDTDALLRSLRSYLSAQAGRAPPAADGDAEPARRALADHLARYGRGANGDRVVQDLLNDRNSLKRLYHDLRKPKPYRGGRSGGLGGAGGAGAGGSGGFGNGGYVPGGSGVSGRFVARCRLPLGRGKEPAEDGRSPPLSPPPLIEVRHESLEELCAECGTQTSPIPEEVLAELERAFREREAAAAPASPTSPPGERRPGRRRSSVDNDDVSQSVSDTIKRYLRMARKKSVDADKADRFKRINYDKNLRNIKPRMPGEVDDDGPHKGCQTEDQWILSYRDLQFATVESSPTSPTTPTQSHSLLGSLLGRSSAAVMAGGMQKSRSSSSVVQSVSKRLWRTRSRSSSRAAAAWTPQGSCVWADGSGRCVRLADASLLTLSEVERRALQQAALARLHQILGVAVKIPDEKVAASKPKRRPYLLKRKALTTGFFDQSRTKDADKEKDSTSGSVFGVPLSQCVETERALRRALHGGSRASLASLGALDKGDDSESCDSGDWGWAGVEEGCGPRVPALVSACLAHLRRHGLHTVGLFRVSSSKKRVRQLREDWERSHEAALDAAVCPNDVATLLKEFLRDLPDPLLCRDLYPAFILTQKLHKSDLQWEATRLLILLLPTAHRDTLNALLSFLAQLAAHAHDTQLHQGHKMDAGNLATIMAPNLLHKNKPNEAANVEQLAERTDVINVVRQLIERQAELWTLPAELLHEAYIHLAHHTPQALDPLLQRRAECAPEPVNTEASESNRRVWSRESFLHGAAATGGPGNVPAPRRSDKSYSRSRRTRDAASDTSSGSLSSAMTIVTRMGVYGGEECASSGVACSSARTDSAHDSVDSATDNNDTLAGSDDDLVITASLHIPFPPSPRPVPPRRRSTSGSDSSKRDSAVGSASSSPPASPPPAPLRVTVTAGEVRRPADIDRIMALSRERNTSDARAVVLRQHDESTVRSRSSRHTVERREDADRRVERREDADRRVERREDADRREERREERRELYKRGELISSARSPDT